MPDIGHRATYPPSTGSSTPVMLMASSLHRKTAASAQSSAVIGSSQRMAGTHLFADLLHRLLRDSQASGSHEARIGHSGRADGVHTNAEWRRLDGQGLGQLMHAAFGGAVDGSAPTDEARDRASVQDHPAAALLLETEDGVLRTQEDTAEIDAR